MSTLPHTSILLLLLFTLLLLLTVQQYPTTQALYTCFGYSANHESVCGGHGPCQGTDSCVCIDSKESNTIFSSWSGRTNTLNQEISLYSTSGTHRVIQQSDGNLVIYTNGWTPIYASVTQHQGTGPYSLVLYLDGTLQIRGAGGTTLIKQLVGACAGTPPYRLTMQNDGNLWLYGAQGEVCWISNSYQGGQNAYLWEGSECTTSICYGTWSTSSNVCSGHGSCISRDVCSCHSGYSGSTCATYYCNDVIYNSATVCSGNGVCSSSNNCTCQEGYFGDDCEWFTCSNVLRNESNVCSGFGTCTAFETCQCDQQHRGKNCEINICNGRLSNSSNVCSGHGQCNSFNNCTCDENYSGDDCEIYNCFEIERNSSQVCSGFGSCISFNNCSCNPGYYGFDCSLFDCFGVEHLNSSTTCSRHGLCLSPNNCSCQDEGYYGSDCELHNCYETLFNNSAVCSTHGQCNTPNNCSCQDGYYGLNCENHDCFGVYKNSSNVCFTHGQCISPNNCSCQTGYYGHDCSNHNCFSILFNETMNVCSGHGDCLLPDNCTCQLGYFGNECEQHKCFETLFNNSAVCSTHGQCISPNNCSCQNGYYGLNCESHDCFGVYKNLSNVCFTHGQCISPNNCSCQTGYYGHDCSNHNCFSVLFNETMNVCSGKGVCHVPDNCTCQVGYYGIKCEMHNCFNRLFNDSSTVCSAHGQCVSPDTCSCNEGFTNTDCSINTNPFAINISRNQEVIYLELDNKNVSIEINVRDELLKYSPNITHSWTCVECDGKNVIFHVESNRLIINSTLKDITQAGIYTFNASSSISNIEPFQSRKSNVEQFKLIVKYDLNVPTLESIGMPSVFVSVSKGQQSISTVINSVALNQTTIRNFLSCNSNCSNVVSYMWSVQAGSFIFKSTGSVTAKFDKSNQLTFSPSVPVQVDIPSQYLTNENVTFSFSFYNGKQQNITSNVEIQVLAPASPPSSNGGNSSLDGNIISVFPKSGVSMNDEFSISIESWDAPSAILPLQYAIGYFDTNKVEYVRLTEYSLTTVLRTYLPFVKSSSSSLKTRTILETTETISLVVFVKDNLGNEVTEVSVNVTVSPFNGTQEEYIQRVQSLRGVSLIVATVDQSFALSADSVSVLISNIVIDPKDPSSALSSLESLTSNNGTLTSDTVNQVINKLDSFVSNLTDLYLKDLELYGFVKSAMSDSNIETTVQIISNCFSTSYNSDKVKETANLITSLIYYGIIPVVLDQSSTELPSKTFKTMEMSITVSSFILTTPSEKSQSISDGQHKVGMNLTSILSKYDAYSMTCGTTMIIYSKNTNYDASVSNLTISSSVNDFKFMKKVNLLILDNLESPIILSFSASTLPSSVLINSTTTNSTYHCKYWDEQFNKWNSSGCYLYGKTSTSIECACSHTTMFTTFLETKTTSLTILLKEQVSSLYYAQISFGIIYLIVASGILIGLIVLRKSQPITSRLLTPYVGLIALIVECGSIYIIQRSILVDQLNSTNSQMWESGDAASNIIANIVMIIVNTLNLTAIFCYVLQVFRFQFMKLLYKKLSENRTKTQNATVLKALKYSTSQPLFYSLVALFACFNLLYWTLWVILRRTIVLNQSEYTYVVSVSYTTCILSFGLIITAVAIIDMSLSSRKEIDEKKKRRNAINFSAQHNNFSLEHVNTQKKSKNLAMNGFNWLVMLDGPLYFRMEMFLYIISFILLVLNQIIGLSSLSYRFENLTMFKLALTFDSISFIFEVLYVISYLFVFGGYALIVAIVYKIKQRKPKPSQEQKQNESEEMNAELRSTLESEDGYELFAKFCEKEFSSENLFLLSDLKANPDVTAGDNLGGLFLIVEKIYDQYIKTGATHEVNIPSKSRNSFVQLFEKCKKLGLELVKPTTTTNSNPPIEASEVKNCFDLLTRQVVMNLIDTFSRFVFTPDYLDFKALKDAQIQLIEKANIVYGI